MAIVRGDGLRISVKTGANICRTIKGKSPDKAIELLEKVIEGKFPIRVGSSEAAHQKSRGLKNIAGAKFPKAAAGEIIDLIKQLKANSAVNGIENPVIATAKSNKAPRPFRRDGTQAKRAHIYLEAREFKSTKNKNKKEK